MRHARRARAFAHTQRCRGRQAVPQDDTSTRMSAARPLLVVAPPGDSTAERVARLVGAPLLHPDRPVPGTGVLRRWLHAGWETLGTADKLRGAELVYVRAPASELEALAHACTLAGVRACLCTPTDTAPPPSLPRLHRRWHRFLFASQTEARAWGRLLPLGRVHVVRFDAPDAELARDLQAVVRESRRMAMPDVP